LGLNWGRPSEEGFGPGLDDKYTAEIFYRFQWLKIITITADVQIIAITRSQPERRFDRHIRSLRTDKLLTQNRHEKS
jgi:hypothetical protein